MSTKDLLETVSVADTVRRWLVAPETIQMWVVSTAVWMTVVFSSSLVVGSRFGLPKDGIALGIFLSGLCVVFTVDRMWRRLDDVAW